MRRRVITLGSIAALLVGAFVIASTVTGADERDVIRVERYPDGSQDVYIAQADGETIIEHHTPDGQVWFESNEVIGANGEPIICPNGEPLRVDFAAEEGQLPSPAEAREAARDLPEGKRLAYNEYTGEFQSVDAAIFERDDGTTVTIDEPLVYECNADNEPALVPLSEVDPEAAKEARKDIEEQLRDSDDLTGLGTDPARARAAAGR